MDKEFTRREFLKYISSAGTGLFLASYGLSLQKILAAPGGTRVDEPGDENVTFISTGHAQYESLRQGFNRRIQKRPRVIALCKNTMGVVAAMKYSKENNLPVAIKSGGHSFEGFSSS